jgi:hypothetical protein
MKRALKLIGALIIATGCSQCESKKTAQKIEQSDSRLTGAWVSDCVSNDFLELSQAKRSINFGIMGDSDKTEYFYSDEECQTSRLEYQVVGTYQALEKENELKKMNFTINKAHLKATSEATITLFNSTSFCGVDNWVLNEPMDIQGRECLGFKVSNGDVIFDSYRFDGDHLLFGNSFLLLSEDDAKDRPESVNADIRYVKK